MTRTRVLGGLGAVAMSLGLFVHGCGGTEAPAAEAPAAKQAKTYAPFATGEDMSRCDLRGRTDREVSETKGPGAEIPNIRRVYAVVGDGLDARRVLICREVDTNLDGKKDVVRVYTDRGDSLGEQADTNYDGRIDTWLTFSGGRILRLKVDSDHDGRPDETQHFLRGRLSRIERDTNRDGKADIWEIYSQGHLQRMGVDLDRDGHVDRWDRDEVAARRAEEQERAEEERAERERHEREATDGGVTDARVSARQR